MDHQGRGRWRRWAKRGAIGAALAVAAVVGLVAIALAVLSTPFGGERVRRLVLPRVNQSIVGHLEVGRLRTHLSGIELWDVTLTDPEGQVVAKVARLELALVLRRLLSNHLEVSRITIERPHLHLVQSARGLNLSRAIAARQPAPEKPPGEPSQLELALRQLRIDDGQVAYRDVRAGAPPAIEVVDLDVAGSGTLALGSGRFDGELALDAQTRAPLAQPLTLRLSGAGESRSGAGKVGLKLAWGQARVAADLDSQDQHTQSLSIEEISIPPALVRAFAPGAPLRAVLASKGKVERRGDRVQVRLQIDAGSARGQLRGPVDFIWDPQRVPCPPRGGCGGGAAYAPTRLAQVQAGPVRFTLERINLAELLDGGPPSRFDLVVEGQGGGRDLARASGQVRVEIPPGQLDGRAFGPVRLDALAAHGKYTLRALDVALPGLVVTASGTASAARLQLEAAVLASDLALTGRSLRLGPKLGLAGQGKLAVAVSGPATAPRLVVNGQIPSLRVAGNQLSKVTLSATVLDARRAPAGTNVRLKLASARLGKQTVKDLDLDLASQGSDGASLKLTAAAPMPWSLTAAGRRGTGAGQVFDLDSLSLSYPEASWRLERPVRLRLDGNDIALGQVDLRAAPAQRLQLDFSRRGQRIATHVTVSQFDLARLPAMAQPPGNRLAGLIDAALEASGRLPRPEATVELRLAGGKIGSNPKLQDLALALKASHRAGRIAGTLGASALGADHSAVFDLPVTWPPPASARLQLRVALGEIDLAQVAALAQPAAATNAATPPVTIKGRLAATLALEGPAADPALAVSAHARRLQLGGEPLDDIQLSLHDPIGKSLQIELATSFLGRKSAAQLESPVVLASWLRRPPTTDALLEVPFVVRANVDQLPLSALNARRGSQAQLGGVVSARAALTGPVRRLHGSLNVNADDVRVPGLPATDAKLDARLGQGREGLDAKLVVSRQGKVIADLKAALGVGIDDLLARRSIDRAPIQLKGHVGPLVMQRLAAAPEPGTKGRRPLRAEIEADLSGSGTLGDPRCELRAAARNVSLQGRPLGSARAQVVYRDARPVVNLEINSAGGGQLTLAAKGQVDLSLPAVTRGIKVAEVPVQSKLTSRGLDLAFLSGLSDDVRIVEGRLEADAQVSGKLGAPQLVGKLGWKSGRLVLTGYGDMRDIDLALRGDAREMVLERLFARAGNGTATLSGRAVRQGDERGLAVEAKADLDRFRVQTEGQALGALSLKARARGTITPDETALTATIDESHMELAGGNRRNLQSLSRPDDVVLLVNGEPLDTAQARRYEKLVKRESRHAAAAGPSGDKQPRRRSGGTRILVEAPRNIWVRGDDVNLELGLDPGFAIVVKDELRIIGNVRVRRGFVEVLGRKFELAGDSTVGFTGPPDRPVLSVDATHRVEGADKITVTVHIEGPTDKLSFALRSPDHPELGDSDLLTVVATGRMPDAGGAGFSPQNKAASLVGGLLADRLQKVVTSQLPLDVFQIEPGDQLSGARLEAGTYIGDDFYVAYVGRLGGYDVTGRQNRNEVHLEYQLSRRWSFEAIYGDARQGSVNLLWTKNY